MKVLVERMPQRNAKNAFGFARLLSAQDFAQRGPLEIVVAGHKLGTTTSSGEAPASSRPAGCAGALVDTSGRG
jgi:hypothetical protein